MLKPRRKKRRRLFFLILLSLIALVLAIFFYKIDVDPPNVEDKSALHLERKSIPQEGWQIGHNFIKKNAAGLWEMYVEGAPFERGAIIGNLQKELMGWQEYTFIKGLEKVVPSKFYLHFLKYAVAWQNRNLDNYVMPEYQEEIYGISFFAADSFDYVGPKFTRKLYYHAAHDIGHTLQNLGLVGCTGISAWDGSMEDSSFVIARNFDFSVGEEFAREKVVAFIKPDQGIPFVTISWPGMIGNVSGMNIDGLVVTLNAGPAELPAAAKTPVSILARKILQYASNIEDAISIAEAYEVFVSENIMVGSAKDNKTIVIEKSPDRTAIFDPSDDHLFCTNHFQSESLAKSESNENFIEESTTVQRINKLSELYEQLSPLTIEEIAQMLRDKTGVGGQKLGVGNELAIHQMIAHHSIIFQPDSLRFWISTHPHQSAKYISYNLKNILGEKSPPSPKETLEDPYNVIKAEPWLNSEEYRNYKLYQNTKELINAAIQNDKKLASDQLIQFEKLNPNLYETYHILGLYYATFGDCEMAIPYFEKALTFPIAWKKDKLDILESIETCH